MSADADSTLCRFIDKLQSGGVEYFVEEEGNATLVQIGRFGYWFNGYERLSGGWIQECSEDWQAEWREWAALLQGTS